MKGLFNLDNPLMQLLSRVGDLIVLNVLTLLCSLPILTAGAAQAALHRVCQDMAFDTDSGVIGPYFRAFRVNFRQATILWLGELVLAAVLVWDVLLITAYLGGSAWMYILMGILALLAALICAYLMPLIARYDNTLRQHLNNAVVLALMKLPTSLLLAALNLLPLLLALISLNLFFQVLIFWVFLGFALVAYIQELLLRRVYTQMEKRNDPVTAD